MTTNRAAIDGASVMKLPIKAEYTNSDNSGGGEWLELQDADGTNPLWKPYNSGSLEDIERSAEYIVNAVNSYDSLVAELEAARAVAKCLAKALAERDGQ